MPYDQPQVSIPTTHTGSLPRPDAVRALLAARDEGDHGDSRSTEAILSDAVTATVDRQLACGLTIVSDGEMSKPSYATYVKDRLTGFGGEGHFPSPADLEEYPAAAHRALLEPAIRQLKTPRCIGPVTYRGLGPVRADLARLAKALRGRATGFVTAASPGVIALFLENAYYPTREAYVEALADAMRTEYRAIHESGMILQIDAPELAMSAHMIHAGDSLKELRRHLGLYIDALNHAVADIPPSRMRLHVCWGNYEGPHHRDVELRTIVDLLLDARPSGLSFVAANPRHAHEWALWKELRIPEDKVLIPGVIDTTTNIIEHPDGVAERIVQYARIVGPDRVIAGTDCGFETFAGLHAVEPAVAWSKLEALVEGARRASASLRRAPAPQVEVAHG